MFFWAVVVLAVIDANSSNVDIPFWAYLTSIAIGLFVALILGLLAEW